MIFSFFFYYATFLVVFGFALNYHLTDRIETERPFANLQKRDCPRGNGVIDSVHACGAGEAGKPGSIPALSKWFFLSGIRW